MKNSEDFRLIQLVFSGKRLNPEKISSILDLEPDDSSKRGDRFGKGRTCVQGSWAMDSKLKTSNMCKLLTHMVNFLIPIKSKIRKVANLPEVKEAYILFAVQPSDKVSIWSHVFDKDILKKISSMNLDVVISIHK